MTPYGRFVLAGPDVVCNQKCFMITGKQLKYLCALLNSKLVTWFVRRTAVTTGMGLTQWDKFTVERTPIARPDHSTEDRIGQIVNSILTAIEAADEQGANILQQRLDTHIFEIYDLTEAEIEAVSSALKF